MYSENTNSNREMSPPPLPIKINVATQQKHSTIFSYANFYLTELLIKVFLIIYGISTIYSNCGIPGMLCYWIMWEIIKITPDPSTTKFTLGSTSLLYGNITIPFTLIAFSWLNL